MAVCNLAFVEKRNMVIVSRAWIKKSHSFMQVPADEGKRQEGIIVEITLLQRWDLI